MQVPPVEDGQGSLLPMPEWAVREMVADWLGAGRVYEGQWPDPNNWTWLETARSKMRLHPITEKRLEIVLYELREWS